MTIVTVLEMLKAMLLSLLNFHFSIRLGLGDFSVFLGVLSVVRYLAIVGICPATL